MDGVVDPGEGGVVEEEDSHADEDEEDSVGQGQEAEDGIRPEAAVVVDIVDTEQGR